MKARRSTPDREAIEQAALRYLARKDRTESQVKVFLQRRDVPPDKIQGTIRRLRRLGYLDDEGYARRWAGDRIAKRPMGRLRLEAELLAQGFEPALVDQTLNAIYCQRNERALAVALLKTKGRTSTGLVRQARLLRSHGFSEETIEAVLRY